MDTKTALLESAELLVRTRGFDAFSYADLSKEIGIRKASIHYHFPTKADLALDLIARYRRKIVSALQRIVLNSTCAAEQLNEYLKLYRDALCDGRQVCLCVAFSATRDSFDAAVMVELNRFHEESIIWLSELFAEGQADGTVSGITNPVHEAHACLALVVGAQLVSRAAGDPTLFDLATAGTKARMG